MLECRPPLMQARSASRHIVQLPCYIFQFENHFNSAKEILGKRWQLSRDALVYALDAPS